MLDVMSFILSVHREDRLPLLLELGDHGQDFLLSCSVRGPGPAPQHCLLQAEHIRVESKAPGRGTYYTCQRLRLCCGWGGQDEWGILH